MLEGIIRLLLAIVLAFGAGKLASMLKMPSVLGFLIAGMALGPHAFGLLSQEILDALVYHTLISILECDMGLMLGTKMIWRRMRSYGKQIAVITLAQSLATFFEVSLVFSLIFYFMDIPIFLGLIFGGIAPAPALSIVSEYKTDGPVTKTLIPLAVMDDVIAICVFFVGDGTCPAPDGRGFRSQLPGASGGGAAHCYRLFGGLAHDADLEKDCFRQNESGGSICWGGGDRCCDIAGQHLPDAPAGAELHAQRHGLLRSIFQSGGGTPFGGDHEVLHSCHRCLLHLNDYEPGGTPGLSPYSGGRRLYGGIHPLPGSGEDGRCSFGCSALPRGTYSEKNTWV